MEAKKGAKPTIRRMLFADKTSMRHQVAHVISDNYGWKFRWNVGCKIKIFLPKLFHDYVSQPANAHLALAKQNVSAGHSLSSYRQCWPGPHTSVLQLAPAIDYHFWSVCRGNPQLPLLFYGFLTCETGKKCAFTAPLKCLLRWKRKVDDVSNVVSDCCVFPLC